MEIRLTNADDVDQQLAALDGAARRACDWLASHDGPPLDLLKSLKFEPVGFHPVTGDPLNFIEQVNQTFTYIVALKAAREIFRLHPDCGPLLLAPGAHAAQALDIMSEAKGLIGAETFAAVTPRNNGKLGKDLEKLSSRPELHRYVFFASPVHPGTERLPKLEKAGVKVWSIAI